MPVKQPYHHGDLRRGLVAAAQDLLHERGSEAVTLRGVAARVGVSSAAPYRHFADKDALLVALAMNGHAELQQQAISVAQAGAGIATVHELARTYIAFAVEHPQLYRLMMGAGITDRLGHADLTQAHDVTCQILIDAVSAAQRAGEVADQDPVGVAVTIWSLLHGLSTLVIDGLIPQIEAIAEADRSLAILESGLRPPHSDVAISQPRSSEPPMIEDLQRDET